MKKILGIAFVALIICFLGTCNGNTKCEAKGRKNMKFSIYDDFSLTNAEGKKFTYHQFYDLGGNMKIYKKNMYSSAIRMEIDASPRYVYKSTQKQNYISLTDDDKFTVARAIGAKSIIMEYGKDTSNMTIQGKNIDFRVTTDMVIDEDHLTAVEGIGTNAEVFSTKKKVVIKNLTGPSFIEISDMKTGKDREICFFPTSSKVTISNFTGKNIKIKGAKVLVSGVSKKVEKFRAIPISPNQMLLSFNRVKGAKGYIVYRYDESSQKYEKIADLEGNKSTFLQDKFVKKDKVYRYKVSSYKKKKGKKKESKMSYEVSAMTSSKKIGNATKVTLNKSGKRKLKKGKSLKLKAKITGEKGKKLVSKDIRWCSKNKKVAVVDKKGRVKALKKGVCKIHAKAHNGKNSKAIIIKVV